MSPQLAHLDDETSLFAQRELTKLRAKIYEREYPQKKMANGQILPISVQTEAEWDDFIEVEEYDIVGMAAVIADYSKGGPRVGTVTRRIQYRIKTVGDHVGWSYEEINKARTHNRPLQAQRLRALREACDNYLNQYAYSGDADYGLPGIYSGLPIPRYTSSTTLAAAPNADAMISLLVTPFNLLLDTTNGMAMPARYVLDQANYSLIASTLRPNTDTTVLEATKMIVSSQGYEVDFVVDQNVKGKGDGGTNTMLILPNDEDKICLGIQMPFIVLPEQSINLETIVHALMRTSLVQCPYPLESLIVQGI
jgi:hypothetical protein